MRGVYNDKTLLADTQDNCPSYASANNAFLSEGGGLRPHSLQFIMLFFKEYYSAGTSSTLAVVPS